MLRKVALVLIALVTVSAILFFVLRKPPGLPKDGVRKTSQVEADPLETPPPLPYIFQWREGDVRSVDVPMQVMIESIGIPLPLYPVQDMVSEPGESKLEFLHRVRQQLVAYSDKHTHEACGEVCSDGTAYSIRITSTAAVAYCAVAPVCVAGHQSIAQSIHSHCPSPRRLQATLADQYLSNGVIKRGRFKRRCDTETFSALDLKGRRPGWLAGKIALYQHDGPGEITRHAFNVATEAPPKALR
jgi:hypothetical protein